MKFISAEEFLNQPKELQKVFIDWWEPSIGDLATDKHNDLSVLKENTDIEAAKIYKGKSIPLLTEGQLRKFIEDKTVYKLEITQFEDGEWNMCLCKHGLINAEVYDISLLKAYWKVALEIAEESVENE